MGKGWFPATKRRLEPVGMVMIILLLGNCYGPARERAERDRTVGEAHLERLSLRVVDGLAAIREAEEARILIWQSAPSVHLQIECLEALRFSVQIRNTMPSAIVTSESAGLSVIDLYPTGIKTMDVEVQCSPGNHQLRIGPPDADVSQTFRFMLMSDVQEAIDTVGDLYQLMNEQPDTDFLLGAGDLTERGTPEELSHFERELEKLNVPYYTTLGNHELGVDPPIYHDRFGRGNFSFTHKGARFTLLDTASATLDPLVYDWLDRWLDQGRQQFHVVAMHIPPVDPIGVRNGSFASRDEANKLLRRLAEDGVDLTLYGHIHSYYSFRNAGVPAYISGGGGAIPERFDGIDRHFVVFDVDPQRQTYTHQVVRLDHRH